MMRVFQKLRYRMRSGAHTCREPWCFRPHSDRQSGGFLQVLVAKDNTRTNGKLLEQVGIQAQRIHHLGRALREP